MLIQKTEIPSQSILGNTKRAFDYIDSFQCSFSEKRQESSITKIGTLFMSGGPKWADTLLAIRDKIVKPFGLKTSDQITGKPTQPDDIKYELGERLGIFKLFEKTENEIVLGEDDTHLNFRVSLLLDPVAGETDEKRLSITTAVTFNNLFGRIYFLPVKPFHRLIVRKTLRNIVHQIESETVGSE